MSSEENDVELQCHWNKTWLPTLPTCISMSSSISTELPSIVFTELSHNSLNLMSTNTDTKCRNLPIPTNESGLLISTANMSFFNTGIEKKHKPCNSNFSVIKELTEIAPILCS